jgi:uncharacterized repeat protein (TIGR03943 family)
MKSPDEYLKQWLHPIVFGTWTLLLVYLIGTQRYIAFLRPEFGLLLALAHFIAMGFLIAALIRRSTTKMDFSGVLRALVLLVPILYVIIMPDAMLGSKAFKNRYIGPTNMIMGGQDESSQSPQQTEKNRASRPQTDKNGNAGQGSAHKLTILDLFRNPTLYQGQRVMFTGMILRDEQLKQYFGGRDTAVYRFLITCCAADALPLAVAVNSDQAGDFTNDQWVQVDGIFKLRHINGRQVPLVENVVLSPVEAPRVPYLF